MPPGFGDLLFALPDYLLVLGTTRDQLVICDPNEISTGIAAITAPLEDRRRDLAIGLHMLVHPDIMLQFFRP